MDQLDISGYIKLLALNHNCDNDFISMVMLFMEQSISRKCFYVNYILKCRNHPMMLYQLELQTLIAWHVTNFRAQ